MIRRSEPIPVKESPPHVSGPFPARLDSWLGSVLELRLEIACRVYAGLQLPENSLETQRSNTLMVGLNALHIGLHMYQVRPVVRYNARQTAVAC